MKMLIYLDQSEFLSQSDQDTLQLDLLEYGLDLARFYSAITTAIGMLVRTDGDYSQVPAVFRSVLDLELFDGIYSTRIYQCFIELLKLLEPQWRELQPLINSGNFTLCFQHYNHRDIRILAYQMNSLSKLM